MPALSFAPGVALITTLRAAPLRPLQTWMRQTEERFRPRQLLLHEARETQALASAMSRSLADGGELASILRETGTGKVPTIVLGGLVPDSTEQVFLLRRFLLKSGDIYYVQYPRDRFSLDLLCAQLSDLVAELSQRGLPPIVLSVSFGSGIVLEWLRRQRLAGLEPALAGLVFVSPIACVADLLGTAPDKPATLLGRALKPYLDPKITVTAATVEKSRTIFARMFEAGAQNKAALQVLMSRREVERLRSAVMTTIRGVTWQGAHRRVQALASMRSPTEYFSPALLPLSGAPTLVLFAEREDLVLDEAAPVRLALERAAHAYFPDALVRRVTAGVGDSPVQHASLVFHVFNFLPHLHAFYHRVRRGALALAA